MSQTHITIFEVFTLLTRAYNELINTPKYESMDPSISQLTKEIEQAFDKTVILGPHTKQPYVPHRFPQSVAIYLFPSVAVYWDKAQTIISTRHHTTQQPVYLQFPFIPPDPDNADSDQNPYTLYMYEDQNTGELCIWNHPPQDKNLEKIFDYHNKPRPV